MALSDTSTDMPPVLVASTGCQAGAFFDNDVIPPSAPYPKLPLAYTYGQFEVLLAAYPDVHPEDFVTWDLAGPALSWLPVRVGRGGRRPVAHGGWPTHPGQSSPSDHAQNSTVGKRRPYEGRRGSGPSGRSYARTAQVGRAPS